LKEVTKVTRTLAVHLNLFGFDVKRDLQAWVKKTKETGKDGAVWLTGQAGATLSQQAPGEVEEVSFLFDARLAASGTDSLAAELTRSDKIKKANAAQAMLPQHLRAAEMLGLWIRAGPPRSPPPSWPRSATTTGHTRSLLALRPCAGCSCSTVRTSTTNVSRTRYGPVSDLP